MPQLFPNKILQAIRAEQLLQSQLLPAQDSIQVCALAFKISLKGDFLLCLDVPFFTAGSRPPLILQSPPPYAPSPREGGPDQKQQLQQRKKTPLVKEEKDMYDIVSSPNKDSTKLTLKLSRVKSNESDPPGEWGLKDCKAPVSLMCFLNLQIQTTK